jgi:P pilus assembly chaperone PapD
MSRTFFARPLLARPILARTVLACAAALGLASHAQAEMVLSQVIVDLLPGKPPRDDIEVFNDGPERMYVSAEPFEIRNPGTAREQRVPADDPQASGLLVSPRKLVLEPGERRIVRVAAIGERSAQDRVYRVAIKPVAGPITAEKSALKVFVGYDALVLVRPATIAGEVTGSRQGKALTLTNAGNTARELFDGRQCNAAGKDCRPLPAKRLYPGVTWQQTLPFDTPVTYTSAVGPTIRELTF